MDDLVWEHSAVSEYSVGYREELGKFSLLVGNSTSFLPAGKDFSESNLEVGTHHLGTGFLSIGPEERKTKKQEGSPKNPTHLGVTW